MILLSLINFLWTGFGDVILEIVIFFDMDINVNTSRLPEQWWKSTIGKIMIRIFSLVFIVFGTWIIVSS